MGVSLHLMEASPSVPFIDARMQSALVEESFYSFGFVCFSLASLAFVVVLPSSELGYLGDRVTGVLWTLLIYRARPCFDADLPSWVGCVPGAVLGFG